MFKQIGLEFQFFSENRCMEVFRRGKMTIISLFSLFFSKFKTIKLWIQQAKSGDSIELRGKTYKESIQFEKDVTLCGDSDGKTILQGIYIIPKGVRVTFQYVTISPSAQMYVEGEAIFEHCKIIGEIDVLVTANNGYIKGVECEFAKAKEIGVALLNNSVGVFENCKFHHNGNMQLFIKNSKVYVELCEFYDGNHACWLTDQSFMQSKNCYINGHWENQMVVKGSHLIDYKSRIEQGEKIGLFCEGQSDITLNSTLLNNHKEAQVCVEYSLLKAKQCMILLGDQEGLKLSNTEAYISNCEISNHKKSNVMATKKSKLHMEHCQIQLGQGYGVYVSKESIANFYDNMIKNHQQAQLVLTEKSIGSLKSCSIIQGQQVGLLLEKKSECMLVQCRLSQNGNSAIHADYSRLSVFQCHLSQNNGNGILAVTHSNVEVDGSEFSNNLMPHIACKTKVKLNIHDSDFHKGKSIFVLQRCEVHATNSKFHNSMNVQIELNDECTGKFEQCQIFNGKSYGVKVMKNSNFFFYHSQIFDHELAQIVVNDSSVILNDSEVYKGKRNGLFIQNHSEVYIQDSFISKHLQSQIWIDYESTLELISVQLTDGAHSDLHAQNQSKVYVTDSIIRNENYRYNVQALNNSKIDLIKTIVENKYGDVYYSENNSSINNSDY